jgi:hypothetical protein
MKHCARYWHEADCDDPELSIFGPKLANGSMGGLVSVESDRARHAFLCHGEIGINSAIALRRKSPSSGEALLRRRCSFTAMIPGLAEWLIRTTAFLLPIAALSFQDHDCGGCTHTI